MVLFRTHRRALRAMAEGLPPTRRQELLSQIQDLEADIERQTRILEELQRDDHSGMTAKSMLALLEREKKAFQKEPRSQL